MLGGGTGILPEEPPKLPPKLPALPEAMLGVLLEDPKGGLVLEVKEVFCSGGGGRGAPPVCPEPLKLGGRAGAPALANGDVLAGSFVE